MVAAEIILSVVPIGMLVVAAVAEVLAIAAAVPSVMQQARAGRLADLKADISKLSAKADFVRVSRLGRKVAMLEAAVAKAKVALSDHSIASRWYLALAARCQQVWACVIVVLCLVGPSWVGRVPAQLAFPVAGILSWPGSGGDGTIATLWFVAGMAAVGLPAGRLAGSLLGKAARAVRMATEADALGGEEGIAKRLAGEESPAAGAGARLSRRASARAKCD